MVLFEGIIRWEHESRTIEMMEHRYPVPKY